MDSTVLITLATILGAIILFATEVLSVDIVALLAMSILVVFGVITPEEGMEGFSNGATLTVLFMFVISAAVMKTGALQQFAVRLSNLFKQNFRLGMLLMMLMVALISAFINNTPVVAVFIPVIIQIANRIGKKPSVMLIPLSFASIMGGMCSLFGSSTNILVDSILRTEGLKGFGVFSFSIIGIILLGVGVLYMIFVGLNLLPSERGDSIESRFDVKEYVSEIQLNKDHTSIGQKIMNSSWVREMEMDIIEVRRKSGNFSLPPGDFILQENDILKVQCNLKKLKDLKDQEKSSSNSTLKISREDLKSKETTMVEMVVTSRSSFEGKTLKDVDFRRLYRSVPLAVKQREEVIHSKLYETVLQSGDLIVAEVKNHYLPELKKIESKPSAPFVLLSESEFTDFSPTKFGLVLLVLIGVVSLAAFGLLPIYMAALLGVLSLVLVKVIDMKDAYRSINWQIIFLLVGALSLGKAIQNVGIDTSFAHAVINYIGDASPYLIIGVFYISCSILTEVMSNTATAALMTPIALATANALGMNYEPLVLTIMFAASASFVTPIGYQTNAMVYSAGQYKFRDFIKIGIWLNILFMILAVCLIPVFFPI